jgi:hypothetical protein
MRPRFSPSSLWNASFRLCLAGALLSSSIHEFRDDWRPPCGQQNGASHPSTPGSLGCCPKDAHSGGENALRSAVGRIAECRSAPVRSPRLLAHQSTLQMAANHLAGRMRISYRQDEASPTPAIDRKTKALDGLLCPPIPMAANTSATTLSLFSYGQLSLIQTDLRPKLLGKLAALPSGVHCLPNEAQYFPSPRSRSGIADRSSSGSGFPLGIGPNLVGSQSTSPRPDTQWATG